MAVGAGLGEVPRIRKTATRRGSAGKCGAPLLSPASRFYSACCCADRLALLCFFSRQVRSLWPYGLQHTRLLCPPRSPGVCSNSCSLSQWCHLTIYFLCLLPFPSIFPSSGSFPVGRLACFISFNWGVRVFVCVCAHVHACSRERERERTFLLGKQEEQRFQGRNMQCMPRGLNKFRTFFHFFA